MWKIGLASAALTTVCLAAIAQIRGNQFERRGRSMIAAGVVAVREEPDTWQVSNEPGMPIREVIWRPDATGPNPFGFIPNHWTARPQLLPLTWDVRTMFASDVTSEIKPEGPNVKSQTTSARVD